MANETADPSAISSTRGRDPTTTLMVCACGACGRQVAAKNNAAMHARAAPCDSVLADQLLSVIDPARIKTSEKLERDVQLGSRLSSYRGRLRPIPGEMIAERACGLRSMRG